VEATTLRVKSAANLAETGRPRRVEAGWAVEMAWELVESLPMLSAVFPNSEQGRPQGAPRTSRVRKRLCFQVLGKIWKKKRALVRASRTQKVRAKLQGGKKACYAKGKRTEKRSFLHEPAACSFAPCRSLLKI